ncbi:MAG: hypothetical protein PHI28_05860 [Mangrovibacterium sp.]|nr:hypothetical protein [Mangrovibacterium sp.]
MNEGYILEWLDNLITVELNPRKAAVGSIPADDITKIHEHIAEEKHKIMMTIKLFVFSVGNEISIKSGIKLYHSTLIALLNQSIENKNLYIQYAQIREIYDELIACIDELISFIESRFALYLDGQVRLPYSYLSRCRKEVAKRISSISDTLSNYREFQPVSDILIQALLDYLDFQFDQHQFNVQDAAYLKELCSEIEQMGAPSSNSIFSELDERLIYMNFNDRTYVDNLVRRFAEDINSLDSAADRMEKLLFHLKTFKQLRRKPNMIFNRQFQDLYSIVTNWLRHEISYLEKRMRLSVKPLAQAKLSGKKNLDRNSVQKVMCSLSSDQIALLIRAAAELEILIGRSLNSLFRIIVPHVSRVC